MSNERDIIPFTDNFNDDSTEAGFQFTFYCDKCEEGYTADDPEPVSC